MTYVPTSESSPLSDRTTMLPLFVKGES